MMRRSAIALARALMALAPLPALAQAGAVQPMPPAAQLEFVAEGVRIFAARALRDPPPPPSAPANPVSEALAGLESSDHRLLSSLFGQSIQRIHLSGNRAIAGWWHPFANGWTLTRWTVTANGWRLDGVGFALGETLGPNERPWTEAVPGVVDALQRHGARAAQAFDAAAQAGALESAFDPARARAARNSILARHAAQMRDLASSVTGAVAPNHRAAIHRALIADAGTIAGNHHVPAALTVMPSEVRLTLRPMRALRRPDGMTYVVQSPLEPSIIVFVHFASAASGEARPARIDITQLRI